MNNRGFDIADAAIAGFALLIFLELFGALLVALAQGGA
jgi:hypothetical protein